MKEVGLRQLKNKLSEHVRDVRAGARIVVTDRGDVVAELIPAGRSYSESSGMPKPSRVSERPAADGGSVHGEAAVASVLRIRQPAPGAPAPGRVPLPRPLKINVDIAALLDEERQSHR